MNRTVVVGSALLAVSAVGAATSIWYMGHRISGFNKTLPDQFLFKPSNAREVYAFGRKVTITDVPQGAVGGSPDYASVRLSYGDSVVMVPVITPKVADYKDLSAYEESLRLLQFAPIKEGQADITPFSDENWRAVLIARETRPGFDEETWGQVRVKDWTWLIYELKPDGSIAGPRSVQFRDRRGRTPAEIYARDEIKKSGKDAPPLPEAGGPRLTSIEPIDERTWEWQAALFTIPKMYISRYRYRTDGVSSMGWTFAGAGVSVLGVMAGAGLVMAGKTPRRTAAAHAAG